MKLSGSTALVTGANRGLGRHFATALLERGAKKVYATARRPEQVDLPGVEVLPLDITDPDAVAAAARAAGDVDVLINNAGITTPQPLMTGDLGEIRRELDTHFFGTLSMIRAFAPVLGGNGGGAIVNLLSVLSWRTFPGSGGYAAAKAAQWSLTESARLELAGQGTLVAGVILGATDTDMMAGWDVPKNDPAEVVRTVLDGVEQDLLEILADDAAVATKAGLPGDVRARYPELS
ncbi:SDR family oxidoreductase [Kribbella sp. CA-253562]|uniref:SDR family oxidoreductase n=1 Tax=Kribbella sp. CA-253562 TaxID=3239942 RepID=UPI003D8C7419